jgi:hypothetical protein
MVIAQDKARSAKAQSTDNGTQLPTWCAEAFPDQVSKMQNDLANSLDQIKKASAQVDYIQNTFQFCSQSLSGLDFANNEVTTALCKVFDVLGWKATPTSSESGMLTLKNESGNVTFASIAIAGIPERTHLGALIVAQTELWQANGAEASAFVIYDEEKYGPVSEEIIASAKKRSVGVLPKMVLLKNVAKVLLAEADPDDTRLGVLQEMGL